MARWHHPDKELRPQAKPGHNQFSSGGVGPRLSPRSRLQSIFAKRRRVEQALDGHRAASAPSRFPQDESKRHHDTVTGALFSPSWDGTPSKKISPSPSLSPTSTKLRASVKEPHHQGPHHQQSGRPMHAEGVHVSGTNRSTTTTTTTTTISQLMPCHICHRRPTTHSLLDAYADCNLCGCRTCYICLRECLSPYCMPQLQTTQQQQLSEPPRRESQLDESMAGRRICSACAVEGVTEYGEDVVWCLDCVERDGEVEMAES